jgi:hypothetical protein
MLPDFPALKQRLLRLAWFEHRRQVEADGLIGAISAVPYFEGRRFATGDVEGYVEQSVPEVTAIPYEIERSAIIERGLSALSEGLKRASELQIQAMHEMLFRKHGEATARVGNQVDAGGQPFSADLYFKMLETVQIDFDDYGRPDVSGVRLVMHPDQAQKVQPLMAEWQNDEAFQRRYREIMLKKRDEWRDRESNRKLVD